MVTQFERNLQVKMQNAREETQVSDHTISIGSTGLWIFIFSISTKVKVLEFKFLINELKLIDFKYIFGKKMSIW